MTEADTTERIVERGGRAWRVREVVARTVPGSQGPRCLICESIDVVRRLWFYPSNWYELDDDALNDLCEQTPRRAGTDWP